MISVRLSIDPPYHRALRPGETLDATTKVVNLARVPMVNESVQVGNFIYGVRHVKHFADSVMNIVAELQVEERSW